MISLFGAVDSLIENHVIFLANSKGQYNFRDEIFQATKARNRLSQYLRNLKVAEEFEREVTPNLVSVSLQELKRAFEEGETSKFIELCKKMNGSLEHLHKPEAIRQFFDSLLENHQSKLDIIIQGFREVFDSPKIGLRISNEQFVSLCSNGSESVINLLKNLDPTCFYKIMESILKNQSAELPSIKAFKYAYKFAPEGFRRSLQIYNFEPHKYRGVPILLREFLEHQVVN